MAMVVIVSMVVIMVVIVQAMVVIVQAMVVIMVVIVQAMVVIVVVLLQLVIYQSTCEKCCCHSPVPPLVSSRHDNLEHI